MTDPKLVRDHTPEILAADGGAPEVHKLETDDDFRAALLAKLSDKTGTVTDLVTGRQQGDLVEEMADVLEVLRALADCEGSTWAQVERAATSKRYHRGSFQDRVTVLEQ